jgi:hypothetical protein
MTCVRLGSANIARAKLTRLIRKKEVKKPKKAVALLLDASMEP